jgi:2-polyprenyl-6-methoxyphenol hydroxylase-like FAD-dependent oxidoreductase
MSVLTHGRTVQGSWTSIRHKGRDGYQWWVLTATDPDAPAPSDLKAAATALAAEFPAPLPGLIDRTEPDDVQRWVLRDRPRLQQWSKGRSTLVGDAAHPTSPYAAYGAGMSIEDGYLHCCPAGSSG